MRILSLHHLSFSSNFVVSSVLKQLVCLLIITTFFGLKSTFFVLLFLVTRCFSSFKKLLFCAVEKIRPDFSSGNIFLPNQNANSSNFRMFSSFNAYPLQYEWLYSFQSICKIAFCLLNSGNIHTRIAFLLEVAPSLCKSLPGIYWQMCLIETWRHKKKYFFSN